MLKNNWRPTASFAALKARAALLEKIRLFFKVRGVLEVETPLLMATIGTDLAVTPLEVPVQEGTRYLQTSPEFAMKRLLAAYPEQPFFQLCKAFRAQESGARHSVEFTLLEWYRPGWDLNSLQAEVEALLTAVLKTPPAKTTTYARLFELYVGGCPFSMSIAEIQALLVEKGISAVGEYSRAEYLDLLMSHCIEPHLGHDGPLFVREYPKEQAALARVHPENPLVAERFECYIQGIELANAYDELCDPVEQRKRFEADNRHRILKGKPAYAIDECFLESLQYLPEGSGIALGVDRLCLIAQGATRLSQVMAFGE